MIDKTLYPWGPDSFVRASNEDNRMHYRGNYILDGVMCSFWLHEQQASPIRLRGRMQIISKQSGHILKTGEPSARNVEASMCFAPADPRPETWQADVIKQVEHTAMRLMHEHSLLVRKDAELAVTPDTLSPQTAVLLYADKFFRDRHKKAGDKLLAEYRSTLQSVYSHLPIKPMQQFTPREIKAALQSTPLTTKKHRLVWSFWDYCISAGLCSGANPIPAPVRSRQSTDALQAKADRLDVLDQNTQLLLYRQFITNPDSRACGAALMLWGNFSASEACKLTWGNLLFLGPDYIAVKYRKTGNAGSTHNYTRVLFIQAARILTQRMQKLQQSYSHDKIMDMPIVSNPHDSKRAWIPNLLNQFGRDALNKCGIDRQILRASEEWGRAVATRVFQTTYASNLIHQCGLKADDGIYRYMCGKSLIGDTTQDNYNCYSCYDGLDSQFAVVRRMAPEATLSPVPVDTSNPDYDEYTLTPDTTLDPLSFSITLSGLQEGQTVQIINDYGLNLQASVSSSVR